MAGPSLTAVSRCVVSAIVLVSLVSSSCFPARAQSARDTVSTEAYSRVELTFESLVRYPRPQADVELRCVFTGPGGESITLLGYWEKELIYKVRFAPPTTGTWSWRSECGDPANAGLHDRTGSIEVAPADGADIFRSKGWPRVSDDGRYLSYADGDPWFYLADTAWEMVWKGRMPDIAAFISDRKAKRFSAVQFCAVSHQANGASGMYNQSGEPTFLNEDMSLPNASYFRILDSIVTMLNDSGMVAVIAPLWAYFAEPHRDDPRFRAYFVSRDQAREWARYIGARYAGDNVMWIVAGDKTYGTPEQQEYWSTFAMELRRACGGIHLMTMHCSGSAASFHFFDNTTPWLDFHMFQSSHAALNYMSWDLALDGFALQPPKPVLDGEATYEDLYENFWIEQDSSKLSRFTDMHVRRPRYQSLLSGASVGVTYGANGVYQWFTPEYSDNHYPSHYVQTAWTYPGSGEMTVLRGIMEALRWHEFVPAPETWTALTMQLFVPAARTQEMCLTYFPVGTTIDNYRYAGPAYLFSAWLSPRTGIIASLKQRAPFEVEDKPDTLDWLLLSTDDLEVFTRFPLDTALEESWARINGPGDWSAPNPCHESSMLHVYQQEAGTVNIDLCTPLGNRARHVFNGYLKDGHSFFRLHAAGLPPGLYYAVINGARGVRTIPLVKY